MGTAIQVENLWWRYPTFSEEPNDWTLRDISFTVEEGECIGITGPSGSGKTTLCRALLGIIPAYSRLTVDQLRAHFRGSVSLYGYPANAKTLHEQRVGMVMQDPENQFLRMSLLHEIALGLQILNLPQEEIIQRSYQALQWVGLGHLWQGAAYLHPADLSGGQKQRVAIASFLALQPRILVLDEPTSDLDPIGKREVIEVLTRLRREYQMSIILVEQDPDILSAFCDRLILLHDGRIENIARPHIFYREQEKLERCGAPVSELVRLAWQLETRKEQALPLNMEEAVEVFTPYAKQGLSLPMPLEQPEGEIIMRAERVGYCYEDGSQALQGVDLQLYRGEMLALLGPNGSGKTTFAKVLAGLHIATSGKIEILGQNLASRRVRRSLMTKVGYVFQNPDHQLFRRSVKDEVESGLKNLGFAAEKRKKIVAQTLEAVNLTAQANEDPLFLSKGERQRLAVAAILAMGPEILVVDEPTTGQDARSIAEIMQLACALQKQGKTILIITHDMTLVAEYCQRVVSFRDGHVAFMGSPRELFSHPEHLRETGLRAPLTAALATRLRAEGMEIPELLTVDQWLEALGKGKAATLLR